MKSRSRAKPGAKPGTKLGAKPAAKAAARVAAKPRAGAREAAKPKTGGARGKERPENAGPVRRPSEREAAQHFVRGLLIRGEAARARRGKLPPGATHEIVEEPEEEELPKLRRRRFSLA